MNGKGVLDRCTLLGEELIATASRNDPSHLARLLATPGINIDYQDSQGRTALFAAAMRASFPTSVTLYDAGASALIQSSAKFGPLQMFAVRGWITLMERALRREARADFVDKSGYSLLMHAADGGEPGMATLLLANGADVHFKQRTTDTTPMHLAAGVGCIETMTILADAGAEIHPRTKIGTTPLHSAARSGYPEACAWLLERGADIDARTGQGYTPLMMAIVGNNADAVAMLLAAGADDSCTSNGGNTLATMAVRAGNEIQHTYASWRANRALRETLSRVRTGN